MKTITRLVFVLFTFSRCTAQQDWNYNEGDPDGPDNWPGICNTGTKQSPIDISLKELKKSSCEQLEFENYDIPIETVLLWNNGDTVKFTLNTISDYEIPRISGGGLSTTYKLAQLHFHWGAESHSGSEHRISGRQFPMETHMVHYKEKFNDFAHAVQSKEPDALAVFAILFELTHYPNPDLDHITLGLQQIQAYNSSIQMPSVALESLLPDGNGLCSFYRYYGSLTTPMCNEIVVWTVFKDYQYISEGQMDKLRHLARKDGEFQVKNYRPLQKLGRRKVLNVNTCSEGVGPSRNYDVYVDEYNNNDLNTPAGDSVLESDPLVSPDSADFLRYPHRIEGSKPALPELLFIPFDNNQLDVPPDYEMEDDYAAINQQFPGPLVYYRETFAAGYNPYFV